MAGHCMPTSRALAARLLEAVALSLELDRHYFDGFVQGGNSILRVLHYPPAPDAPKTPRGQEATKTST